MNKKLHFVTALLCLCFAFSSIAEVPTGYYTSLNGKQGKDLKTQISTIALSHTILTYSSLWKYFRFTDVVPNTGGRQVWDMYSSKTYYFSSDGTSSTSGMNKEHSFPKSWWGGTVVAAYTDLNHLYPSDGPANSAKLNYPLGIVSSASFDNGVVKVGTPKTGLGGGSSSVFEPADEYKGDFARTYFYMATTYQDYNWVSTFMLTNSSYLDLQPWAYNMLLEWSRNDPVSQKELDRNEAVYQSQGNRNPFIDDPSLAEYIWGNKQSETYYYSTGGTTGDPQIDTPAADSNIDFGPVALGKSVQLNIYVKGTNIRNSLTVTIYKKNSDGTYGDASMFKSSLDRIPASSVNTEKGYMLTLTYTPTAIGSDNARITFTDGGLSSSVGMNLTGSCLAVPSLSQLTALPAEEVTDSTYRACWNAAPEEVDNYLVTRTIYKDGAITSSGQFNTDDTYYIFNDLTPGTSQTYYVQSVRLGYQSAPSNVITVTANSGIEDAYSNSALGWLYTDGGLRFVCDENHTGGRIFNMQGQVVRYLPVIENNMLVELPSGVYIVKTNECKKPLKIVIK